jgi:hypothetical protein
LAAAPICSAATRIGSDIRCACRRDPRQRPCQVHRGGGCRRELGPPGQRRAIGADDDIRNGAIDDVVGIEGDGPDRRTFGQPLERVGVGFVGGEQRQLGECGAQQRRGHQRPTELFEDDGCIGEFASGTA